MNFDETYEKNYGRQRRKALAIIGTTLTILLTIVVGGIYAIVTEDWAGDIGHFARAVSDAYNSKESNKHDKHH